MGAFYPILSVCPNMHPSNLRTAKTRIVCDCKYQTNVWHAGIYNLTKKRSVEHVLYDPDISKVQQIRIFPKAFTKVVPTIETPQQYYLVTHIPNQHPVSYLHESNDCDILISKWKGKPEVIPMGTTLQLLKRREPDERSSLLE